MSEGDFADSICLHKAFITVSTGTYSPRGLDVICGVAVEGLGVEMLGASVGAATMAMAAEVGATTGAGAVAISPVDRLQPRANRQSKGVIE